MSSALTPAEVKDILKQYNQLQIVGLSQKSQRSTISHDGIYNLVNGDLVWASKYEEDVVNKSLDSSSISTAFGHLNVAESDDNSSPPNPSKVRIPTIFGKHLDTELIAFGHLWTEVYLCNLCIPKQRSTFPLILKIISLRNYPNFWQVDWTDEDLEEGKKTQQMISANVANEHHAYVNYLASLQGTVVPFHYGTFLLTPDANQQKRPYYDQEGALFYSAWNSIAMLLEDVGECVGLQEGWPDEHDAIFGFLPTDERQVDRISFYLPWDAMQTSTANSTGEGSGMVKSRLITSEFDTSITGTLSISPSVNPNSGSSTFLGQSWHPRMS
ncbi:uncharacterized protein IL334_006961 [Kwoniella shivajii]|uniref:HNH nuclease domain-containing protein n=1 Tax=Kwoniella shivajii TaxID=564305 RepID=A0ABZ1D7E2_9TREE|nr:hypothetical protein IL334_006961 [Kwoniella shivajii]